MVGDDDKVPYTDIRTNELTNINEQVSIQDPDLTLQMNIMSHNFYCFTVSSGSVEPKVSFPFFVPPPLYLEYTLYITLWRYSSAEMQ